MAKTANSLIARGAKYEITVTAAQVAAIAGLTTAEDIDCSSIVVEVSETSPRRREIIEDWVIGDVKPILDQDPVISKEIRTVTIFYTQGKDTLGTDLIDIYSDYLLPVFEADPPLPFADIYSPAGGASGDEEYIADAETFITQLNKPVGGSESAKVRITFELTSVEWAKAVVP